MTNAILLDERDNVATYTSPAVKGDTIKILGGGAIFCVEDIPIWHKVALKSIRKGEKVFKYGEVIGKALVDIPKGGRVFDENIFSVPRDYASEYLTGDVAEKIPAQKISSTGLKFYGYKRDDGRAGIRNHVLILPTCACGSETARIVASQVRGAVNIIFNTGCSDVAANTDMSQKILTGFACNPNVFGVVIIGLGCETVPHNKLREKIQSMTNKPVVRSEFKTKAAHSRRLSGLFVRRVNLRQRRDFSRKNFATRQKFCSALNAAARTRQAVLRRIPLSAT